MHAADGRREQLGPHWKTHARELTSKEYTRLRPDIDRAAPGGPTMEIIDPFGNVLRFCEPSQG